MNIKKPVEFLFMVSYYKISEEEGIGVFCDFPDKTNEYVNLYGEGHIILERYLSEGANREVMLYSMGLTTDMDDGEYLVAGKVGLGERGYQLFLEFEEVAWEICCE